MSQVAKTHYQAKYDFEATGKGQLNIKVGEKFVLVTKTGDEWWTVRSSDGNLGLVPASYLEPFEEKEEALSKEAGYVTLYEFTGQDNTQLSFKQGETLYLVDKTDHSWWSMRGDGGKVGLVPVNYIDKAENVKLENVKLENGPAAQVNGKSDAQVFQEVMLSIDNAMEKLHSDAAKQGGSYTPEQRASLQRLVAHRTAVVEGNKDHAPTDPAPYKRLSPTKLSPNSPRRQAPPPPTQSGSKTASVSLQRGGSSSASNKKDNRLSLQVDSLDRAHHHHGAMVYGSLPKRSAPRPPQRRESLGDGDSDPRFPQRSLTVSGTRPTQEPFLSSASTFQPQQLQKSSNLKPYSPEFRRHSADTGVSQQSHHQRPHSAHAAAAKSPPKSRHAPKQSSSSSPGSKHSPGVSPAGSPKKQQTAGSGVSSGSPSRQMRRTQSASTTGSRHDSITEEAPVPVSAAPVATSPQKKEPPKVELPTDFVASDGAELVEVVRVRTGMSYKKSLLAVGGVLEFLKNRVEACSGMVDALLSAVQQSQSTTSPRSARKLEGSSDLDRLKDIFFELTECKDDSQQRGWAVHDDQEIITEYLDELLQILCDADPAVTKVAVQEDKYENVLTLITYYQMESRVPIRLLLLKVFGVLCGLDTTVVSVLLTSVLPNELGRDIQDNLTADLQKTLYSSTVSVMVFSTGEAVPLPVYDQWTKEFVLFLLDTIEKPPEEDFEDQVPDAFLNMILSYNQHFQDPSTNLVMRALRERPNPRNFSEKLMFLVNRGEDPVALSEPCCPDSITKFLLDLFADKSTSGMFYTTDMMVLIDIVTRQLTDLGPGEETRTHYLDLFNRIVTTTNYPEHKHRQKDLTSCFNRIAQEEHPDSQRDHEMIKKIWITFPGMFEEVTDL